MSGKKDELERAARHEVERRRQLEQSRRMNVWLYLSWLGSLGWLVALPTVAGALAGRFLDRLSGSRITFAAAGTLLGAAFGLHLLWRRLRRNVP